MSDLLQLADRCEAATGPDREIDGAIAMAIGKPFLDDEAMALLGDDRYWGKEPDEPLDMAMVARAFGVPMFTASLDAAMTLVPEGAAYRLYSWPKEPRACSLVEGGQEVFAATPALALCAAALRARSAHKQQSGDLS